MALTLNTSIDGEKFYSCDFPDLSISTANTMPQQLTLSKDESQLADGKLSLTFGWEWLPWNVNTAEWQLIENGSVIRSAFIAANSSTDPASGMHTEQVTAEQIGYGDHTLSWRVRAVKDANHRDVMSSWAKGEDIQFTFINPEGIENVVDRPNTNTRKLIKDGQFYILKDETLYTLLGQPCH